MTPDRSTHTLLAFAILVGAGACASVIGLEEGQPFPEGSGGASGSTTTGGPGGGATSDVSSGSAPTSSSGSGPTSSSGSGKGGAGGSGAGGKGGAGGAGGGPLAAQVWLLEGESLVDIAALDADDDQIAVLLQDGAAADDIGCRGAVDAASVVRLGADGSCSELLRLTSDRGAAVPRVDGLDVPRDGSQRIAVGGRSSASVRITPPDAVDLVLGEGEDDLWAAWFSLAEESRFSLVVSDVDDQPIYRSLPSWDGDPLGFVGVDVALRGRPVPADCGQTVTGISTDPALPLALSPEDVDCPGPLVAPDDQPGWALDVASLDGYGALALRTSGPEDTDARLHATPFSASAEDFVGVDLGVSLDRDGSVTAVEGGFLVAAAVDTATSDCVGTKGASGAVVAFVSFDPSFPSSASCVATRLPFSDAVAGYQDGDEFIVGLRRPSGAVDSWILARVTTSSDEPIVQVPFCTNCTLARIEGTDDDAWIAGTLFGETATLLGEIVSDELPRSFLVRLPRLGVGG